MSSLLLLVLAQAVTPVWDAEVFTNATPWKSLETGAITVDSRPIKDSVYFEYRTITETPDSVDTLCTAVFEWGTKGSDSSNVKLSKLLKDGDDERVVYNQIEQPVVSNRDYAMTVVRKRDASSGTCRIRFRATNEFAPPLDKGVVRMNGLWGSWTFEPLASGKSRVTYTLFSDPGGSVPAFLVHGPQKSAAKDSIVKALQKAAQASAKAPEKQQK